MENSLEGAGFLDDADVLVGADDAHDGLVAFGVAADGTASGFAPRSADAAALHAVSQDFERPRKAQDEVSRLGREPVGITQSRPGTDARQAVESGGRIVDGAGGGGHLFPHHLLQIIRQVQTAAGFQLLGHDFLDFGHAVVEGVAEHLLELGLVGHGGRVNGHGHAALVAVEDDLGLAPAARTLGFLGGEHGLELFSLIAQILELFEFVEHIYF